MFGVASAAGTTTSRPAGCASTTAASEWTRCSTTITRIWAGEERGYAGGVGPDVSDDPPTIIVGGQVDAAFRRAARYGDGWMMGGGPPEAFPGGAREARGGLSRRGPRGQPRKMSLTYFSLDADPEAQARRTIGDYYASCPSTQEMVVAGTAKGEDEVQERVGLRRAGLRRADHVPLLVGPGAGGQAGRSRAVAEACRSASSRSRSRAWSSWKAKGLSWVARPSVSTTRPCSGQAKSTRWVAWWRLTIGLGRPSRSMSRRKRRSSSTAGHRKLV